MTPHDTTTEAQSAVPAQEALLRTLSYKQRASRLLFGDANWLDREDLADQMDDKFGHYHGDVFRRITPNELIAELESADRTSAAKAMPSGSTRVVCEPCGFECAHEHCGATHVQLPAGSCVDPFEEEAAGKTATRLLDEWSEIEGAPEKPPYRETMAFLGKPNSVGWVWAQEVRFERNFDAEREHNRKLATECIMDVEAENERLRAELEATKGYVDRAIASYVGDPADNQFQKGYLAALEVIRDEAFSVPSTERRDG